MKSYIKLLFVIPVTLDSLGFPGCKKFLQKDLQGQLTQQSFPTTAADALLATNASYEILRDWYYNSGGYPILDIMSDDARKGSNPDDQLNYVGPYDVFTFSSSQDGLDRWWNTLYVGVKRANVVIQFVPDIQMDDALRTRYVAEAKFIRGLLYFDFVRAWGGVPLVTTVNPPQHLTRATKDEVYALIIADLQFAADHLPLRNEYTAADMGRATKGTAQALLARVYLFMHDYINAEKYALDVINSNQYGLEPVYADANGAKGNNGIESVLEVGAIQVENTDGGGSQYGNVQGVRGTPNRGWGFNRPSIDFRNSFETGDARYKGTVIDLGDTLDGCCNPR